MRTPSFTVKYLNTLSCSLISLLLVSSQIVASQTHADQAEVNVYSARKEALIKPLLDKFTEKTGTKVNLVTSKGDALLTRLKAEGKNSPADVLITTDVGRLYRAKRAGVLQSVNIPEIESRIAAQYRDSEGFWYGLSLRSRVIVYAPERVKASELSSYTALANKHWHKRVCIRSSSNIYNQSLVASMIAHNGVAKTDTWLKQFVANFAQPPRGGDRDQIKAVVAGMCDVAVVNSYYLGAMLNSKDQKQVDIANKVKLFWPDQKGHGAHMNISGIAVTKAAKNKQQAIALITFLSSAQSQQWYGAVNNEYPVVSGVKISDTLKSWGTFKADTLAVEKLGDKNNEAVKAMDRAGWK
ncbi:MAG: Fe(3+) ABC transporter substrate-binding protein [Alteromonadaceae bacterium]|nr:MAG: Fe(3+) ABC transporter substrate-binding protein [Alteromonadaceae bacterium]